MSWFPIVLFSAFIGWILYSNFTKKGRGLVLGGEIEKTLDREVENSDSFVKTKIKVHILKPRNSEENRIIIEYLNKTKMHWNSTDINLSKSEVKEMISLLNEALEYYRTEA